MDLSTHAHLPWTVCHVTGDVELLNAHTLREHLLDALEQPGHRVLLDLSAVTFMDASGLGVLVFIKRMAILRGGALRLLAPSSAVCRLLMASGLSGHFIVGPDLVVAEQPEPGVEVT